MFPRMRLALACALAVACAHKGEAPEPGATTAASAMPSNAGPASTATPANAPRAQQPAAPTPSAGAAAAGAPATSSTQPVAGGAMTAAEAAQMAARQGHSAADAGQAEGDASPCSSDADCTLTRHPPGSNCPSLCEPRPVTRAEAGRLERGTTARCVMPMCRPPQGQLLPACVQNRCVTKSGGASY
jgi:hypothetical protein